VIWFPAPVNNERSSPSSPASRVAVAVRSLRERRGETQAALSERAGIALRHLQKIEAGEVNLTLHTLARLATALSVDVPDLFTVDESSASNGD
jgi:transcriptional regulator with XRE-family HTH domain